MRILMLDDKTPPLGGGMGTVNEALLKLATLDLPNLEIDLITSAVGGKEGRKNYDLPERIRIIKLPVWNLKHSSLTKWSELFAVDDPAQALPRSIRRTSEPVIMISV